MPLTADQIALLAAFRFTYPDDVKAADHVINAMTDQRDAIQALDDAYVAGGMVTGEPRDNLIWGTIQGIAQMEEAIAFHEQLHTVLDAREAFSSGLSVPKAWVWTTVETLYGQTRLLTFLTSHDPIMVASLDGQTVYVENEHYSVSRNDPIAPYPNQHLVTPVNLPSQVRVTA